MKPTRTLYLKVKACAIVTLLMILHFRSFSQSQELAEAIILENKTDEFSQKVNNKLKELLISLPGNRVFLYDWNVNEQKIIPSPLNKIQERPSDVAIFITTEYVFDTKPLLKGKIDSSGNTTASFFQIKFPETRLLLKSIDAKTSKVISVSTLNVLTKKPLFDESDLIIKIPDPKKEFAGNDPYKLSKSNPKQYDAYVEKLISKNQSKINAIIDMCITTGFTSSEGLINRVIVATDPIFYLKPSEAVGKKIKTIEILAGAKQNMAKDFEFDLYTKRMINEFPYYENLGKAFVDEVGENTSIAKSGLFGNKDLAASLNNKEEVLVLRASNSVMLNQLNKDEKLPVVNVAYKKKCLMCDISGDSILTNIPVINLIERNAPELAHFNNLLKDERFVDYSIEDLQGKQKGYEILISKENGFITASDISTNRNLGSFEVKGKFSGMVYVRSFNRSVLAKILNAYKPNIYTSRVSNTIESKKGKINDLVVYDPVGFEFLDSYNVFVETKETVDGEEFVRKEKLGSAQVRKMHSPYVVNLKIKDGEKELFVAHSEGKKLLFMSSEE